MESSKAFPPEKVFEVVVAGDEVARRRCDDDDDNDDSREGALGLSLIHI